MRLIQSSVQICPLVFGIESLGHSSLGRAHTLPVHKQHVCSPYESCLSYTVAYILLYSSVEVYYLSKVMLEVSVMQRAHAVRVAPAHHHCY